MATIPLQLLTTVNKHITTLRDLLPGVLGEPLTVSEKYKKELVGLFKSLRKEDLKEVCLAIKSLVDCNRKLFDIVHSFEVTVTPGYGPGPGKKDESRGAG